MSCLQLKLEAKIVLKMVGFSRTCLAKAKSLFASGVLQFKLEAIQINPIIMRRVVINRR